MPPAPAPGSARYFALLYTPAEHRSVLALLMALGDEISAGIERNLDHGVAHARLEWWRLEAERYCDGRAQHPWLSAANARLDLRALVQAAALDLAEGCSGGASGERLHGALFLAAAAVLGAAPSSEQSRAQVRALGSLTRRAERASLRSEQIEPTLAPLRDQPRLAPLLVWATLTTRRRRSARPLAVLADNFLAWRVARRAGSGGKSADPRGGSTGPGGK